MGSLYIFISVAALFLLSCGTISVSKSFCSVELAQYHTFELMFKDPQCSRSVSFGLTWRIGVEVRHSKIKRVCDLDDGISRNEILSLSK